MRIRNGNNRSVVSLLFCGDAMATLFVRVKSANRFSDWTSRGIKPHYEPDEVGHGKTGRDFREYESGITVVVNDVTAVLMEGISSGIPSFALLTKISWEFYCKQEKLFV